MKLIIERVAPMPFTNDYNYKWQCPNLRYHFISVNREEEVTHYPSLTSGFNYLFNYCLNGRKVQMSLTEIINLAMFE